MWMRTSRRETGPAIIAARVSARVTVNSLTACLEGAAWKWPEQVTEKLVIINASRNRDPFAEDVPFGHVSPCALADQLEDIKERLTVVSAHDRRLGINLVLKRELVEDAVRCLPLDKECLVPIAQRDIGRASRRPG